MRTDETPVEAMYRELREETGLTSGPCRTSGVHSRLAALPICRAATSGTTASRCALGKNRSGSFSASSGDDSCIQSRPSCRRTGILQHTSGSISGIRWIMLSLSNVTGLPAGHLTLLEPLVQIDTAARRLDLDFTPTVYHAEDQFHLICRAIHLPVLNMRLILIGDSANFIDQVNVIDNHSHLHL